MKKLCPNNDSSNSGRIIGYYNDNEILEYLPAPINISENQKDQEYRAISACDTNGCLNWDGSKCMVTSLILDKIEESFFNFSKKCSIRKECRWFSQDGIKICKTFPVIK